MLFHSLQFLIFLPIVFALYWLVADHPTVRKVLLLIASALFYAAWNPVPFLLVLYCATLDYFMAKLMASAADASLRKLYLMVSIVSNLSVLVFFKYANFLLETLVEMASWLGIQLVFHRLDILLPLGISFVVFQTLSYTVDVYRGDCEARDSWVDVALFISFFPQIIAGPIVRASHFLPQLDARPALPNDHGARAILRIAKGLAKKILIADLLEADIISRVFSSPETYFPLEVWGGVFAYTLQIYYDFSAYSDVAIGSAALFGFYIPENFNRPYKATNLPEFWQRWHISLSTWLRDYLYIPLGGNRGTKLFTIRNLMITMVLGGIWHGANWRMALWGGMHGIGLSLTRLYWWRYGRPKPGESPWWWAAIGWMLTFLSVMLARIFFRAESMPMAWKILSEMLPGNHPWAELVAAPNLTLRVLTIVGAASLLHFGPTRLFDRIADVWVLTPIPVRVMALVGLSLVVKQVMDFEAQTFIYFQF
ncbi:MAG: MBOAT family protein [Myxococcales bacterium]|nr:MBOAT family protein [Myxococcales bacterium]